MRTEAEIVYDILNIVHGGRVSSDNVISERLVRSFLRKHRASKMNVFFNKGLAIYDYVFQTLGELELKKVDENMFSVTLPSIIHFQHDMGVKIRKDNFDIPLLGQEEFQLALCNPINLSHPKAKLEGQVLTVFSGYPNSCDYYPESEKEQIVAKFQEEFQATDDEPKITARIDAVLYDPDSAPLYDWTKDSYPCPSEIIDQIETSTLARDLDLLMRTKTDTADNKSQIDP